MFGGFTVPGCTAVMHRPYCEGLPCGNQAIDGSGEITLTIRHLDLQVTMLKASMSTAGLRCDAVHRAINVPTASCIVSGVLRAPRQGFTQPPPPRPAGHPGKPGRCPVLVPASTTGRVSQLQQNTSEDVEEEEEQAGTQANADAAQQQHQSPSLPAETEAVAVSGTAAGQQELVSEEVEQIVEPLTVRSVAASTRTFLTSSMPGKLLLGGVTALFLGSLGVAVYRAWQKANTARAKRMRQVDRNLELIEALNKYLLAGKRAGLTPAVTRGIQRSSGFTPVEVFRKYLWYLLRERKFDTVAVEDLVALKAGLGLSDQDVGEALRERATRIYDKYGTLMLNTEGLTLSGAQRKATCTALFRKVLFLAEYERLVGSAADEPGGSGADSVADIGKIFGATVEDMERLRIRNLYEAELDLEGMMAESTDDQEEPLPPPAKQ